MVVTGIQSEEQAIEFFGLAAVAVLMIEHGLHLDNSENWPILDFTPEKATRPLGVDNEHFFEGELGKLSRLDLIAFLLQQSQGLRTSRGNWD